MADCNRGVPSANDMRRVAIDGKKSSHNPAFDYALKKASALVQAAAKQRHMSVAYELPEFVHGCPAFKVSACAEHVSKILTLRGFDVRLVETVGQHDTKMKTKVIVISWEEKKQAAVVVAEKRRVVEKQQSLHTCDLDQGFSGLSL